MTTLSPDIVISGCDIQNNLCPSINLGGFRPFWFEVSISDAFIYLESIVSAVSSDMQYVSGEVQSINNKNLIPEMTQFSAIGDFVFNFESLTPSIATVTEFQEYGVTNWVQDGVATISITGNYNNLPVVQRTYDLNITNQVNQILVPIEFIKENQSQERYLGYDLTISFAQAVTGLNDIENAKRVYNIQDHAGSIYERNLNCWGASYDWTGVSPWNSSGGAQRAGALISPLHLIFCTHLGFNPSVGSTIRFIGPSNQVVDRVLSGKAAVPNSDLTVGVLDQEVPPYIKYYKILDISSTLVQSQCSNWSYIQVAYFDQEEKLLIAGLQLSSLTKAFFSVRRWNYINSVSNYFPQWYDVAFSLYETPIGGDSGNPLFFIINGEPVLQSVFWTPGGGSSICFFQDEINNIMTALSPGYQLSLYNTFNYPVV